MVNFTLCVFYHNKKCIRRFGKWTRIKQLFLEASLKPSLLGQERICYIRQGVNFECWPKPEQSGATFGDNSEATTTL